MRKLKRKFLMKVLAATVAATMAVTPSTAFAEGGEEVFADEGDVTEEFGDITADGEGEDALTVYAWDGNEADVTTGSLTSEDHIGADVWADGDSVTWVFVDGDIDSADKGVDSVATDNGFAAVVVDGNINSGSFGVYARAGKEGADTDESASVVQVAGDVEAEESGIWTEACGAGKVEVDVGGNVIGGNEYGVIYANTDGGGTPITCIRAGGDVMGKEIGATLYAQGEGTENILTVEGTLSAKDAAIVTATDEGSKNSITVWKIETPGFTAANWIENEEGDLELAEDEETEKKIQYIIRVNQTDGATLKATDAYGNALATVTGLYGELEYAHEGDKVLLKIDVADGYSLDAAYGDEGQTLELTKDAAGNYYLVVPRNGGVSFSVKLSKNKKDDDKDDDKKNDNNQTAGSYVLSDSAAVSLISSASSGSLVTLSGLSGTGLSASVVSQLLVRRDIDVTVTFMLNGVFYKIVIPAGADIAKLVGADGSVSFEALGQAFGIAPV